jgi:hypothetical protein
METMAQAFALFQREKVVMKAQWGDLQEVSLTKEVEPTQGQAGTACPLGLEVQKPEQQ